MRSLLIPERKLSKSFELLIKKVSKEERFPDHSLRLCYSYKQSCLIISDGLYFICIHIISTF